MLENVPVFVGVPLNFPVVRLKVAHAGLLRIPKLMYLPSGSRADGVNV